jgi:hypothetical protein
MSPAADSAIALCFVSLSKVGVADCGLECSDGLLMKIQYLQDGTTFQECCPHESQVKLQVCQIKMV